jgi:hypothetical protein
VVLVFVFNAFAILMNDVIPARGVYPGLAYIPLVGIVHYPHKTVAVNLDSKSVIARNWFAKASGKFAH